MKNRIVLLCVTVLAVCFLAHAVSARQTEPVRVVLDGVEIDCLAYGQQAIISDGRTLVPLRAIFEALGASVEWHEQTRTVKSTLGSTVVVLTIDDNRLIRNGEAVFLDVPACIKNDRTLVPVRAVAEAFGVFVDWAGETRTVILKTDKYERGIINGKVYDSEWSGIRYSLPYGFSYIGEGELKRITGVAGSMYDTELDYNLLPVCGEFFAFDEYGNSVLYACERNTDGVTSEQYLETAMKVYENAGIECSASEAFDLDIGGVTFKAKDVKVGLGDTLINQRLAVFEKENRFAVFSFTYDGNPDSLEIMLDGFYPYEKAIPPWRTDNNPEIYGSIRFGMTQQEAKRVLSGDIKTYVNVITSRDIDSVFDNEDEKITGDLNIDFISLEFEKNALYNVYVTTEYTTKQKAQLAVEKATEFYQKLYGLFDFGNPDFSVQLKTAKIEGKTFYYCAIDMRDSGIYLMNADGRDVVFTYDRNEKKVPAELEDLHAYGEFFFGMSSEEIIAKAKGEITKSDISEVLYLEDEKGVFADEDTKITGTDNAGRIVFSLNNDILHEIHVEIGSLQPAFHEQLIKRIQRYYGNGYRTFEEPESYVWEFDWGSVSLTSFSNPSKDVYGISLVISSHRYIS